MRLLQKVMVFGKMDLFLMILSPRVLRVDIQLGPDILCRCLRLVFTIIFGYLWHNCLIVIGLMRLKLIIIPIVRRWPLLIRRYVRIHTT
jgi:hypothetical protein